ncbi:hypothetical protein STEG23_006952 [Scotinomys teguina]
MWRRGHQQETERAKYEDNAKASHIQKLENYKTGYYSHGKKCKNAGTKQQNICERTVTSESLMFFMMNYAEAPFQNFAKVLKVHVFKKTQHQLLLRIIGSRWFHGKVAQEEERDTLDVRQTSGLLTVTHVRQDYILLVYE